MRSGLRVHMPTPKRETSISVGVPLRSRWNSAVPMAPTIVLAPWRSKKAAGWNIGSSVPRDILNAMEADAQPEARSNPPVSAIGPLAPQPCPQA